MLAREHQDQLSMNVEMFYKEHGASNRYVEVRSTCNIANKLGTNEEKKLFSILPIPTGTRICPYVSEIYTKQPKEGKIVMEVSSEMFIDAEHHPVDLGYLYYLDVDVAADLRIPPNYARYINTIYPEDKLSGGYAFSQFVCDESGLNVVWVEAIVDIPAGVELLVDYGPAYYVVGHRRKRIRRVK